MDVCKEHTCSLINACDKGGMVQEIPKIRCHDNFLIKQKF